MVRQNFQRCGVDPQFMLADERTRAAYWQDAMEETLDWLYGAAHEDERLEALTGKFSEREIALMMETLYRFLMSRPDPMTWLEESAGKDWSVESMDGEPLAQAFCQEAALIVEGMDALWREADAMRADAAFPPPYLKTLQSDRATLSGLRAAALMLGVGAAGTVLGTSFAAALTVVLKKGSLRGVIKGVATFWLFALSHMALTLLSFVKKERTWRPIAHTNTARIEDLTA